MKRHGLTLPELLTACGLASLVLTGLTVLFVQAVRYHRSLETSLDLQENNLSAMAILSRDLSESSSASLRAEVGGVVMGSPRGMDGSLQADTQGRLLWRKWVCYYVFMVDGVNCLVRKEEALPTALDTAPIIPDSVNVAYFRGNPAPFSVLARDIELLELSGTNPASIHLISRLTKAGELYRIESRTDVSPKN